MRRALLAGLFLALGCGGGSPSGQSYSRNDLQLLTSYTAKEACSCLFVFEQDEAFCTKWTKQSPPLARIQIDREHKEVRASALMLWGATAHWVSDDEGCRLK